jgi:hypothetical protein
MDATTAAAFMPTVVWAHVATAAHRETYAAEDSPGEVGRAAA